MTRAQELIEAYINEAKLTVPIPSGVSKSDADMARDYFKGFSKFISSVDLVGKKFKITIDRGEPDPVKLKARLKKAIADPDNY